MPDIPARLTASSPVLLVRDVVAAANHYRDALGFKYDHFYGDPPGFVILMRDGLHLMLKQVAPDIPLLPNRERCDEIWETYFWVSDADTLHAEFVAKGATIQYGLCNQPYGCREFGVRDLDGYVIGFGMVMK